MTARRGTRHRANVLIMTHCCCCVTGTAECNGNHLSYTPTGPVTSQGEPKGKFQDKEPGNYCDYKTISLHLLLNYPSKSPYLKAAPPQDTGPYA